MDKVSIKGYASPDCGRVSIVIMTTEQLHYVKYGEIDVLGLLRGQDGNTMF